MTQTDPEVDREERFKDAIASVGAVTLSALTSLETAWRHLGPGSLEATQARCAGLAERLDPLLRELGERPAPEGLEGLQRDLARGAARVLEALRLLGAPASPDPVAGVLKAMHLFALAHEPLYRLRHALPPLGRFFAEPAWHERGAELDAKPPGGRAEGFSVGIHGTEGHADGRERGGFSLYVPERSDGRRPLPLVVALHGGSGHGADFLWTWLREARSREVMLLAPSSRGRTWSLNAPALDATALARMLDFVQQRWPVDPERVLLTGLSDGATFSLLAGLAEAAPYAALAPISGVLHPLNFANGNLARAEGRRIYLVHGALDWMFPVALAQAARDALQEAGAELVYREVPDLSHAYPREENARILRWLDPGLALPGDPPQ